MRAITVIALVGAMSFAGTAAADTINIGVVKDGGDTFYSEGMEGFAVRYDAAKIGRSGPFFRYDEQESEINGHTKKAYGLGLGLSFGPAYTPKGATQNRRPFDFRLGMSYAPLVDPDGNEVGPKTLKSEPDVDENLDFIVGLGLTLGRIKISADYGLHGTTSIMLGAGF